MQQVSGRDIPENNLVEILQLESEADQIGNRNMKYLQQFIALATTTSEYFDFCKNDLVRIQEIQHRISELKAPNRKNRKERERINKIELKRFRQTTKDLSKLLLSFSENWTEDPQYKDFVEESIDNIGEVLDKIELK
ncbi:hypothetical protein PP178_04025 [Zeaxanthinibacter sp. PT1]|uniref:hypothetical protein n=1 Tax=Zeaxanthinibacter TaxID=561554 RepID=UPI00234A4D78|nr:hypothetical protein [Zeaxanthinibacter sp. PT1]MDC6350708.1 hypothetical protein [Zeaxanthinibacter sp. PT1]